MARIKIGVVGCGLIAQMMHLPHLRELADAYEVVALCDVSPATLKHVADHYDVRRRYTDYRDLLKDEVEAIAVLSADSHGQVIVDALRAGKHVFTEKPMCYTLGEPDGPPRPPAVRGCPWRDGGAPARGARPLDPRGDWRLHASRAPRLRRELALHSGSRHQPASGPIGRSGGGPFHRRVGWRRQFGDVPALSLRRTRHPQPSLPLGPRPL